MLEGVIIWGERETDRATTLYLDTARRICVLYLESYADTEDIFQTVFLEYVLYSGSFENSEHEEAWVIRATISVCKDYLKGFLRNHTVLPEEITEVAGEMPEEHSEVLEVVLSFLKKYKDVVYLFCYENYTAVEISEILGGNVNTVYTLLARAKVILGGVLGGDDFE